MKCPFCSSTDVKVVNSRSVNEDLEIRRRRECDNCKKRFSTIERVELLELFVVKRDGTTEKYSRDKLFSGISKACNKRPIDTEDIEYVVNHIENAIFVKGVEVISSIDIGVLIMNELKKIDDVAYVRFASVCKQFEDIEKFQEELNQIIKERKNS
ncbi:MAG: transcriptional regulator NrdR [Lachnospirales bacterium]